MDLCYVFLELIKYYDVLFSIVFSQVIICSA